MPQRAFNKTIRDSITSLAGKAPLFFLAATLAAPASAQAVLEEIIVTAQKREQNIQDVPISITNLSGQKLASKFSGGETILALAGVAPGLYAESSNGRHAPRFYMRGLGNADFDQAASQPVSIVFDEVPVELVTFKAFPLFDLDDVEVIRGPQGTLFGRNTTAGILKFDTRRPTEEREGFLKVAGGNRGTVNAEAALSGPLSDGKDGKLLGRISLFTQNRSDWIDNIAPAPGTGFASTGESDIMGGFSELAGRVQLLWEPNDALSVWLMHQRRQMSGNSASQFRANVLDTGSNKLNSNYDRGTVYFDGGGDNPAEMEAHGTTLKFDLELGDYTVTSITSYQDAEMFARGDIDGGYGCSTFCGGGGPGFIPFPSDTGGTNTMHQITQELRLTSNLEGPMNYQVGVFYFEDELSTSTEFGAGPGARDTSVGAVALHENTSWAVFGQGNYTLDRLTLTAGLRYTDDEKDYMETSTQADIDANFFRGVKNRAAPIRLTDDEISWDVSLAYALNDDSQVYGRVASGFRAPSIQSRNVAFGAPATTATSETIMSYEIGYKSELMERRLRLNAAAFYYEIDDMQLTAIGGAGNFTTLLNAEQGIGYGVEFDIDYAATEHLTLSGGFGYNKTKFDDNDLAVAPCGSGACTILDPRDANGNALIDGNPFQHSPEWTLNLELSYTRPLANGGEWFIFTDWKVKGDTNEFLYESIEFKFDTQFEGGARSGFRKGKYEVAMFARNITDEHNPIGGIDFNNNTSYVNQPRMWGVEGSVRF